MAKQNKRLIDPLKETAEPLLAELEDFYQTASPAIIGQNKSVDFYKIYDELDIGFFRQWLNKEKAADSASRFGQYTETFLTLLQQWENRLHTAGVYSPEQFNSLEINDISTYYAFKNDIDEILECANEFIVFLKELIAIFKKRLDEIALTEEQVDILCELASTPNITKNLDELFGIIEERYSEAGKKFISRATFSRYLNDLEKQKFIVKPSERGGYQITKRGLSYLQSIGLL